MTQLILKSFLIDLLKSNDAIYLDSLTLNLDLQSLFKCTNFIYLPITKVILVQLSLYPPVLKLFSYSCPWLTKLSCFCSYETQFTIFTNNSSGNCLFLKAIVSFRLNFIVNLGAWDPDIRGVSWTPAII